jgi:hypothetical protein
MEQKEAPLSFFSLQGWEDVDRERIARETFGCSDIACRCCLHLIAVTFGRR